MSSPARKGETFSRYVTAQFVYPTVSRHGNWGLKPAQYRYEHRCTYCAYQQFHLEPITAWSWMKDCEPIALSLSPAATPGGERGGGGYRWEEEKGPLSLCCLIAVFVLRSEGSEGDEVTENGPTQRAAPTASPRKPTSAGQRRKRTIYIAGQLVLPPSLPGCVVYVILPPGRPPWYDSHGQIAEAFVIGMPPSHSSHCPPHLPPPLHLKGWLGVVRLVRRQLLGGSLRRWGFPGSPCSQWTPSTKACLLSRARGQQRMSITLTALVRAVHSWEGKQMTVFCCHDNLSLFRGI